MLEAANVYMAAKAVIANYGMGVTQHKHGVETAKMIVNLLLLRGNIGKPGAGISPIRGHSNVQGQRTVGISEKTKLVPLDKLAELYGFEPPRWDGLSTVDACEGILKRKVRGFVSLGGNFLRAVPERSLMEPAWAGLRLSVQIATKLNRSHIVPGEVTYLLPCLGRIEIDQQASGPQAVSMEDSTACIHGSRGQRKPVAEHALSEPAIIAGLAKATLKPNPKVDWDGWVADYSRVRDAIERTYPDQFKDFNRRMFEPGGFPRPLRGARAQVEDAERQGEFHCPEVRVCAVPPESDGIYELMTMRADGQFNTTIYTEDDRFRGIQGSRYVVLMNPADMEGEGLKSGDTVTLSTVAGDDVERTLSELQVVALRYPAQKHCGLLSRSAMGLFRSGTMPKAARCPRRSPCPSASARTSCPKSSKKGTYRSPIRGRFVSGQPARRAKSRRACLLLHAKQLVPGCCPPGCEICDSACPVPSPTSARAMSPSAMMPTSLLSRFKTGNRLTWMSPIFCVTSSRSWSSKQYFTSSVMTFRTSRIRSEAHGHAAGGNVAVGDHTDQALIVGDRQQSHIQRHHRLGCVFQGVIRRAKLHV